jgi:hypothetical protein
MNKEALITWLTSGHLITLLERQSDTPSEDLRVWVAQSIGENNVPYYNYIFTPPVETKSGWVGGTCLPRVSLLDGRVTQQDGKAVADYLMEAFDLSEEQALRAVEAIS